MDSAVETNSRQSLIDPTFLFRFEMSLVKHKPTWSTKGLTLPEACRVESLGNLAGRPSFADVRIAWCDEGIAVWVKVTGKRQDVWCRDSRADDSDGLHLWFDTRCSPGIHRATQYCHRWVWLPSGSGNRRDQPYAALLPINRARANPKSTRNTDYRITSKLNHDGYELSGFVAKTSLTGFDPQQQPRIGLYYAVVDRELGWQTLSLGPEYPVMEDPSLWCEAVLEG
ncbi:MAG: hypothetical protein AAF664_19720 [Planctomycetota bacterium]